MKLKKCPLGDYTCPHYSADEKCEIEKAMEENDNGAEEEN